MRLAKRMKGCVLMFSDIKRKLGEKSKRAVALLATLILLCGFTGCDNKEANSTPVAESKDSQNSEAKSGNTGSSDDQNGAQSEFDFDEAVKNITLFGQQISLPCKWSDFGEDFSHDDIFIPADDDLSCNLLYKGKKIGVIFFGNCDVEHSDEIETKPVVCISVGHYDYGYPYDEEELDWLDRAEYYTGLLEFGFSEFTMGSTEDVILKVLGTPNDRPDGFNCHYLVYDYDNGYLLFIINDDAKRNGRLLEMHVCVEVY